MRDEITIGVKVNGPWWVNAIYWAQVAWRVALTALLVIMAWQTWHVPGAVMAEVQGWRTDTGSQITALRTAILGPQDSSLQSSLTHRLDSIHTGLVGPQKGSLKADVLARVDSIQDALLAPEDSLKADVLARVDALTGTVNAAVADANGQLTGIRTAIQPPLDHVTSITAHVDEASAILLKPGALPAQTLGLLAATKVTMGEAAQTAREVRLATPRLLKNSDAATAKTVEAAEQSRRFLQNLADNTTPLPKWIRYPAQVVGLIGGAAVPVVTLQKLSTVSTSSNTAVRVIDSTQK